MHDAFSDLEKDDFLQGLITGKNLQNFIKENEEKKIKYSVVSFEDKLLKINKDYGTGKFVYFMIKFMYICLEHLATINNSEKYTLIIDEPEAFLHPGLIREVGFMLRRVNNKINVICATHSVDFLQYFCTEETDIFYKTVESGKIPSIQKEDFKSIKLSHLKLSKKKETSVINIFNRRKVFLFLMSSKIIFVEGENDLKLMEYILYKDQESKFTKDVLI